jgi:hypothetical protein
MLFDFGHRQKPQSTHTSYLIRLLKSLPRTPRQRSGSLYSCLTPVNIYFGRWAVFCQRRQQYQQRLPARPRRLRLWRTAAWQSEGRIILIAGRSSTTGQSALIAIAALLPERRLQVCNEILDVLETHRDAQQSRGDARCGALLLAETRVGRRPRVGHRGFGVAEVGRDRH